MDVSTVLSCEDESGVFIVVSKKHSVLELELPPCPQCGHRSLVERDRAATTGGLRLGELDVVRDRNDRLSHRESSGVEIDVAPTQAQHFAAPHASRRSKHVGGV